MKKNYRYKSGKKNVNNTADWQNPRITGRNRQRGAFQNPSMASMENCSPGEKFEFQISLDGQWDFKWAPCPALLDEGNGPWESITVPANWELEGYGIPQYSDMIYPYSHDIKTVPAINPEDNPTGIYRRVFRIPENWNLSKGSLLLRFDGIRSAAEIYLNEQYIGYTQNSYSPSEFILEDTALDKENLLTVRVYKWCAGSYLEDQDMWRMAGIIRSVSLLYQPAGGITDVYVRSRFDKFYMDCDLDVTVSIGPYDSSFGKRFLKWFITAEGQTDAVAGIPFKKLNSEAGVPETVSSSVNIQSPLQWSADEPNLYNLIVEIYDEQGKVKDKRVIEFGFRQVEIKQTADGAVFMVNGRPVKLRGVNRHDMHPLYGQAVPVEMIETDLKLMKQNNINALRCSHYPNPEAVYRIANRLGLYVMDEANIETHQLRHRIPKGREEWRKNCIDRIEHMILTHRNHPCVVIWSLGNEAGFGKTFIEMKDAVLSLDSTRPIHYENDRNLAFSDFFSLMYATVQDVERIKEYRSVNIGFAEQGKPLGWKIFPRQYRSKPVLQCEFSHAMGNSLGNFADYIDIYESVPHFAGGFIWDWADQALYKKDVQGAVFLAYGGEFGDFPNDGIFCANGLVSADRKPQPELAEVKAVYAPIAVEEIDLFRGRVRFINKHAHVDLGRYNIDWHLECNGFEEARGAVNLPEVSPGESCEVQLFNQLSDFPVTGECFLTFDVRLNKSFPWAEAGFLVTRLQSALPVQSIVDEQDGKDAGRIVWISRSDKKHLSVCSGKKTIKLNLQTGSLDTLDFGSGNILNAPLEPDFFRAPTDNEQLGAAGYIDSFFEQEKIPGWIKSFSEKMADLIYGRSWDKASSKRKIRRYKIDENKNGIRIRFFADVRGFIGKFLIEYNFDNNGGFYCRYSGVFLKEGVRFGARTVLPIQFRTIRWFGRGPQECYTDRKRGALIGCYEMDADEASYDYLMPQESGNRTDVRWVSFSDGKNSIIFRALDGNLLNFSASRYSREKTAEAKHGYELVKDQNIHVDIDLGQRGVGGSIPGFLTLSGKYKMRRFRRYAYSFSIDSEKTE